MSFTKKFDRYVCDGDTITCRAKGFTVTARVERDDDMGEPWKEHDGHGPVSDWTRRDKRPGERVLIEDRGSRRYYDFAEAVKIARRDGWNAEPYSDTETAGERAAKAAEADFRNLKAWCNDEWWWAVVVLSVSKGGVEIDDCAACLGGVAVNCGDNDYLTTVANELLPEALEAAEKGVASMIESLAGGDVEE